MLSEPPSTRAGTEDSSWFVLRVRSNSERVASAHLRARGYEEFAPSYKSVAQWSDRKKVMERFLFPTYVFCRFNPQDRLPVLTVPGAVNLVGFGAGPTPVPDEEIENIRALVRSGLPVSPYPFLKIGQKVRLEHGPLAGLEGILEQVKGVTRVVVSIHMLQRSVSTEVERGWVQPVAARGPASGIVVPDPLSPANVINPSTVHPARLNQTSLSDEFRMRSPRVCLS